MTGTYDGKEAIRPGGGMTARTDAELNEAVARALGWTTVDTLDRRLWRSPYKPRWYGIKPKLNPANDWRDAGPLIVSARMDIDFTPSEDERSFYWLVYSNSALDPVASADDTGTALRRAICKAYLKWKESEE